MSALFNEILYRPLLNIVIGLYNSLPYHDFGLAIILLTVAVRLVLMPLSLKTIRSQKSLAALAPKVEEVKARHVGDTAAQSAAVMELYKTHNISPLAGCLPLLIQLPIVIALYQVFLKVSHAGSLDLLYDFVQRPEAINNVFLGVIDLAKKNPFLAVGAGVLQFFQAKSSGAATQNASGAAGAMNMQMLYFLPVMIIIITWNLPAGLALYFMTTTAFSLVEQWYGNRTSK